MNQDELSHNSALKNNYSNTTALILATGPSLASQQIVDDWFDPIIAVNEAFYYAKEKKRVPICTILNDQSYFTQEKHTVFLEDLLEYSATSAMHLLFPLNQKERINKILFAKKIKPKIFYFYSHFGILELEPAYQYDKFDFTGALPNFPTVTHLGIAYALYLGFSRIYLLGLDIDYILNPKAPIKHGYDGLINSTSKSNLNCLQEYLLSMNWNYRDLLINVLDQIKCYELIYKICQQKNIEIYNLSKDSILDVFPHVELETI